MSQEIYPNDFFIQGNLNVTKDIQTTGQIISGGQELLGVVSSQISASSLVALSGAFDNLNSVYSTVQSNSSAVWNYQGIDLKSLSANWEIGYQYATVYSSASSTFITSETDSQTLSFDESTKNLSITNGNIISLSALVDAATIDSEVRALTSVWDSTYSTVQANSASWDSVYSTVNSNSATNVKTTATSVPGTSAITTIVAVSSLPVSLDPNTLYIVI